MYIGGESSEGTLISRSVKMRPTCGKVDWVRSVLNGARAEVELLFALRYWMIFEMVGLSYESSVKGSEKTKTS